MKQNFPLTSCSRTKPCFPAFPGLKAWAFVLTLGCCLVAGSDFLRNIQLWSKDSTVLILTSSWCGFRGWNLVNEISRVPWTECPGANHVQNHIMWFSRLSTQVMADALFYFIFARLLCGWIRAFYYQRMQSFRALPFRFALLPFVMQGSSVSKSSLVERWVPLLTRGTPVSLYPSET